MATTIENSSDITTDITKETFMKYYTAQMSGEYNISKEDYLKIITKYMVYYTKFIK